MDQITDTVKPLSVVHAGSSHTSQVSWTRTRSLRKAVNPCLLMAHILASGHSEKRVLRTQKSSL